MGLIQQESDFTPSATATDKRDLARGGAYGLMQMTLATARTLGYVGGAGDPAQLSGLYDPTTNIRLGVAYLAQLLKETGSMVKAVSGYNAGLSLERPGDAKRVVNDPRAALVNQEYVDAVLKFAKQFSGLEAAVGIALVVLLALALSGKLK